MALELQDPRPRLEEPEHPFHGFLEFQGIPIDVENRSGSWRRGVADDGTPWAVRMIAHYGEVRNTTGADGDALDVFVGDDPFAPFVFVIQTKFPGAKAFDECKCMLGYPTRTAAISAFRRSYGKSGFYLGCTKWTIGSFKAALSRPQLIRGQLKRPIRKAVVSRHHLNPGRAVQAYGKAMIEARRRRDLFAAESPPAPNYRRSDDGTRCSDCFFALEGHCRVYDFDFRTGATCDSWSQDVSEVPSPIVMIKGGRIHLMWKAPHAGMVLLPSRKNPKIKRWQYPAGFSPADHRRRRKERRTQRAREATTAEDLMEHHKAIESVAKAIEQFLRTPRGSAKKIIEGALLNAYVLTKKGSEPSSLRKDLSSVSQKELLVSVSIERNESTDPEVRRAIERVMVAAGAVKVNEAGDDVSFDGTQHRTDSDLFPGETAVVTEYGLSYDTGEVMQVLSRTEVKAPEGAPESEEQTAVTMTPRQLFRMKATELRENAQGSGPDADAAQGEIDRRAAKRKGKGRSGSRQAPAEARPRPRRATVKAKAPKKSGNAALADELSSLADQLSRTENTGQVSEMRSIARLLSSGKDSLGRDASASTLRTHRAAAKRSVSRAKRQLDTSGTWPPQPGHFSNKYTKDEFNAIIGDYAAERAPKLKALGEEVRQWKTQMADKLAAQGIDAGDFEKVWSGRDPFGLRGRAIGMSNQLGWYIEPKFYIQESATEKKARIAEWMSPDGISRFDEKFVDPYIANVQAMMEHWSDPALYDVAAGPQQAIDKLSTGSGVVDREHSYALLRDVHGLDFLGHHTRRRETHSDDQIDVDEIVGSASKPAAMTVEQAIQKVEKARGVSARTAATRNEEYHRGASDLHEAFSAIEGRGLQLSARNLRRHLGRGKELDVRITTAHGSDGQRHSLFISGLTRGWNYIGPQMDSKEKAWAAFREYTRQLAEGDVSGIVADGHGVRNRASRAAAAMHKGTSGRMISSIVVRGGRILLMRKGKRYPVGEVRQRSGGWYQKISDKPKHVWARVAGPKGGEYKRKKRRRTRRTKVGKRSIPSSSAETLLYTGKSGRLEARKASTG